MPRLDSATFASPVASFAAAVLLVAACGVTADALASRTAVAAVAPARTGCSFTDSAQARDPATIGQAACRPRAQ